MQRFFVITCFFITFFSLAQEDKNIEQLIISAKEATQNRDYSKALKLYLQGEIIAKRNKNHKELLTIKYEQGSLLNDKFSNYGDALQSYNEALKIIANHPELDSSKIVIYGGIANLHSQNEEYEKSIDLKKKAYHIIDKNSSPHQKYVRVILAINMASDYNLTNQIDKGYSILMEVKDEVNKKYENLKAFWSFNLAENYFLQGKVEQAQSILDDINIKSESGHNQFQVRLNEEIYLHRLELLSKIYETQGKLDLSVEYKKRALHYNQQLKKKIELYDQLANLLHKKKEYTLALAYKDSLIQAKDSLTKKVNSQLYAANEVKLQLNEYKNQIEINQSNYNNKQRLYWMIITAILLIGILVYLWQKNRIAKQKQQNIIIENERVIMQLELDKEKSDTLLLKEQMEFSKNEAKLRQESLKNKISKKNRELTSSALYNSSRIEILNQIIESLEKMKDVSSNIELKSYLKSLKEYTSDTESWKGFTRHFEKVNPGFLKKIKELHPSLNKKDIKFLCYIYMNLGTKEICIILNITPQAFWKRKQRVFEKFNISKEVNLYDYIHNLKRF